MIDLSSLPCFFPVPVAIIQTSRKVVADFTDRYIRTAQSPHSVRVAAVLSGDSGGFEPWKSWTEVHGASRRAQSAWIDRTCRRHTYSTESSCSCTQGCGGIFGVTRITKTLSCVKKRAREVIPGAHSRPGLRRTTAWKREKKCDLVVWCNRSN